MSRDGDDPAAASRRAFVRGALAIGGASALAACLERTGAPSVPEGVDDPRSLPSRQHAWNDVLSSDDDGNDVPPEHHLLLSLTCRRNGPPTDDDRLAVDEALSSLERAVERSPAGALSTLGYSPTYFDRFDDDLAGVSLPKPRALTDTEEPEHHREDALLHLASDEGGLLLAIEEALFGDETNLVGRPIEPLDGVFEVAARRTGFVGEGLPAEKRDVDGVPNAVPEAAPFFMGFRSGLARSQASEDRVTIDDGPFAGGTTMHVERLELDLERWFGENTHEQRVTKLFSLRHAEERLVGEVGERLGDSPGLIDIDLDLPRVARQESVVGHAQKAASARDDGEPRLLRRDVNSTDGDRPGLHFLSLQASIDDFVAVRRAMAGEELVEAELVDPETNNGILEYVSVRGRGNFLVPPRERRALPSPSLPA